MKSLKVDIDGQTYDKPTSNLLGLGILEYVIWFIIGFFIAAIAAFVFAEYA